MSAKIMCEAETLFGEEHVQRYRETDGQVGHIWKRGANLHPEVKRPFVGSQGSSESSGSSLTPPPPRGRLGMHVRMDLDEELRASIGDAGVER